MKERRMAAGAFKTHCLAVMDDVQSKREPVVITKRGRPVVKLVPADNEVDEIFNFMAGKISIVGDIVSPVIKAEEWKRLNDTTGHSRSRVARRRGRQTITAGSPRD